MSMAAELDTESSDISSQSSASTFDAESTNGCVNDPSICSLCHATDRPTTDISDCQELKSIKEYIETSSQVVRSVRFACQTCLYKLYTVIDQNRLKAFREERERRLAAVAALIKSSGAALPTSPKILAAVARLATPSLANGENGQKSPGSPITSEKTEEIIEVNTETDSVHLFEDGQISQYSETPPKQEVCESPIENEGHIDIQEFTCAKPEESQISDEIIPTPSPAQSHLDILYEKTESALFTESGGAMEQYKNPPLQCRYCPKVFVIKKRYQKHMRSHQTSHTSSVRGRNTSNTVYACTDCSATFDSSAKLKNHCRIHLKRFYCTFCHKESLSLFDHDFHEAECKGEHMAKEEFVETRRITRSIVKSARSVVSEKASKSTATTSTPGKTTSSSRDSQSFEKSSATSSSAKYEDDDEHNDDDCATSVAYTDYTGYNSFVEKWVAGTWRSEYGFKSVRQPWKDTDVEPVMVCEKEYDTIMLERLIKQAERNVYYCTFAYCDYVTNTIRDMCLHQIVLHKTNSLYHCRKCRGVFTSKLFLEYHLYMQNFGEYFCNKCTKRFTFEYQFQYHLLLHRQKDEFPCLYCSNAFLSEHSLRMHCLATGHDPKKRKQTIQIDHSLTIVNDTGPRPPPPKRTYTCTFKYLKVAKMKSLSPVHVVWPGGRNIFLGDIDFEYSPGRNCVKST